MTLLLLLGPLAPRLPQHNSDFLSCLKRMRAPVVRNTPYLAQCLGHNRHSENACLTNKLTNGRTDKVQRKGNSHLWVHPNLGTTHIISLFTTVLWYRYYHSHFTDWRQCQGRISNLPKVTCENKVKQNFQQMYPKSLHT